MNELTFGVIGTSRKEDERRIPIHPEHLMRLPEKSRRQLVFEEGYGQYRERHPSQTGARGS